jgi:hypothetical protein
VPLRVLLVALLAAASSAAPVPKAMKGNAIYFPTTVGARWVYETDTGVETAEVSEVEKAGDDWIVSRKGVDGTRTAYTKVVVSADGLRQEREPTDGKLGWVLRAKLTAGDSWELPGGGERTVHGPEEVEVPAGKYQALRVVWEQRGGTFSSWYAPGVGEVKRTEKRGDTETVRRALKSFEVKDAKK